MEPYRTENTMSQDAVAAEQQRFMVRVYNWMTAGMAITGGVAYAVANSPTLQNALFPIFGRGWTALFAWLGFFALINYFGSAIKRMPVGQATGMFFLIAGIMGLFIAPMFVFYTSSSITSTFFITAATFASMSFFGYTTKKDLSGMHSFLIMGFWGLFIASLVNWFLQSPMMTWIICSIGVLVFTGLCASETQQIKAMNIIGNEGTDEDTKEAVLGALILYITFVNLFRFLMYFLGDER